MSAATHTHQWVKSHWHTRVGTHLSSDAPSVGSAPLALRAGGWTGLGAKERQSPHLSHLCSSTPFTPHPKSLLPAPATHRFSPLGTRGPLTVQGGWQGRHFIAPLPVGEGR